MKNAAGTVDRLLSNQDPASIDLDVYATVEQEKHQLSSRSKMSAGYAERLSEYPNKGVCGLPEMFDSRRSLCSKIDTLSKLIRTSSYTVVLTGAGCSTSAGIPDFRGPNGIWTKEQKERENKKRKNNGGGGRKRRKSKIVKEHASLNENDPGRPNCHDLEENNHESAPEPLLSKDDIILSCGQTKIHTNEHHSNKSIATEKTFASFTSALPTYTHRALSQLILEPPPSNLSICNDLNDRVKDKSRKTYIHHIVTQNIDGLHLKSGLPRKKHSILHGDIFTEICDMCQTEHVRSYEIPSIGLQYTGSMCTMGGDPPGSCPGKLKDTLLDWENDLPEDDWIRAQDECVKAELIICMGTSLNIEPAASLCTFANAHAATNKKKKNKLGYVIVNLQRTPYDDGATLVIRGKVDDVMNGLMNRLGYGHQWDDKK